MIRRILVGLFSLIGISGPFAASPPSETILIKTARLILSGCMLADDRTGSDLNYPAQATRTGSNSIRCGGQ